MGKKDMSYMYPVFPILCFFTLLLTLFPIPAHWKAGNVATVALAFWIVGGLLICMINTIVWHHNLKNPYPVWGDLSAAYMTMIASAIASCILCLQFRLWNIARTKRVLITPREKRRQKWFTYFFCILFPLLLLPIHYCVQGHRYNVFEDLGPLYTTHNTWLAFIVWWPIEPTLCLVSSIFGLLTIRLFLRQRKEFDAVLASGFNINKNRYLRLLGLAATAIVIHLPLSIWLVIVNSVIYEVEPYKSWADTHSNWGRIAYVSRFFLSTTPNQWVFLSISWWSLPVAGLSYFVFFGFGEEAMVQYRAVIRAILRPVGIHWPKEEAYRKRRKRMRRTWVDVILCRPGRPINLTSSMTNSSNVMPNFTTSQSHPEKSVIETNPQQGGDSKGRKKKKHSKKSKHSSGGGEQTSGATDQTRSIGGTTTMMPNTGAGTGDLNLDIANLDFLDPAEAKKQARISAYTRPGQAARRTGTGGAGGGPVGVRRNPRATPSLGSSIGEIEEEEEEERERENSSDEEEDDGSSSICTDSNCSCQFSSSSDEEGDEDVTEQRRKERQVDTTTVPTTTTAPPPRYAASSSRSNSSLDEKKVPLETPTTAVAPSTRHITIAEREPERDLEKGVVTEDGDEEEEEEEEKRQQEEMRVAGQRYRAEQLAAHPEATEEITF